MRIEVREPEQAVGHVLCHNLADGAGRRLFVKGRVVTADDPAVLRGLGLHAVRVAVLEEGDVGENAAARFVADRLAGAGVTAGPAHVGRVNLTAAHDGTLYIAREQLVAINLLEGITAATAEPYRAVRAGQVVATVKIIPFAVADRLLAQVETRGPAVLAVRSWVRRRTASVLVAATRAQARVERAIRPAVDERLATLQAPVATRLSVEPDEGLLAEALAALVRDGIELIVVAGETSVVDSDDVLPRALRRLGGRVTAYGAPVEPGNLLMVGYLGTVPVIGAPGCVRSRDRNVVDLLLPRLLADEVIDQTQIAQLAAGGLLGRQEGW